MATGSSLVSASDIEAMVDGFQAWDLSEQPPDIAELHQRIGAVLLGARYQVATATGGYMEAGCVVDGDARVTGNPRDDGVRVIVQLGKYTYVRRGTTHTLTTATVAVDDGQQVGQVSLKGDGGFLYARTGAFARSPSAYQAAHRLIEGGWFNGAQRTGSTAAEDARAVSLQAQAVRILGACAVNPDATALYEGPDHIQSGTDIRKPLRPVPTTSPSS